MSPYFEVSKRILLGVTTGGLRFCRAQVRGSPARSSTLHGGHFRQTHGADLQEKNRRFSFSFLRPARAAKCVNRESGYLFGHVFNFLEGQLSV